LKLIFFSAVLLAISIPALTGRVVDDAGMLSPEQRAALTGKLEQIEKENSVQIVVLTVPSLQGEPIEDFAVEVAQKWAIGQKGLDNGAVLVVAKKERQIRIEVGYGLEGIIPDGLAGRIIREQIAPHFKQNDFYGGLDAGINALALAARKEYPLKSPEQPAPEATGGLLSCLFIAAVLWFVLTGMFIHSRSGGWVVGGLAAAILFPGALLYCNLINAKTGLILSPLGFLFGALATPVARRMRKSQKGRRWRDNTWTYPGGWRGGGGFGGGGSGGGGGFGGGGGHFGGGGASGSW